MDNGQTDTWLVLVWTDEGQTDGWTNRGPQMFELLPLPQAEGGSQVKLGAYRHEDS